MKSARWFVSYLAVAIVGLGLAFTLSLRLVAPAHSQNTNLEAPSSGDLPPEFLNDMNKTPAPSTATDKEKASGQPVAPVASKGNPKAPPAAAAPTSLSVPANAPIADEATASAPAPSGTDGYVYDPTGRRDPFAPYRILNSKLTEKQIALEPLQRWDIERLKVVGILWEVHNPRAMVKDPEGHVYTIVKNTKVGRNNGYVSAIREGEVVVVEMFEVEGSTNKETKILELGK